MFKHCDCYPLFGDYPVDSEFTYLNIIPLNTQVLCAGTLLGIWSIFKSMTDKIIALTELTV